MGPVGLAGVRYRRGSPGSELVFETIELLSSYSDDDGVSIPADSIIFISADDTIRSAEGVDAVLTHLGIAPDDGHRVNVATTITPGAPRDLTATPGDGQVTLNWLAPTSDGGSAITDYDYRYKVGSGAFGSWTSAGTDLTETVSNLTNGQVHTFEVRAANTVGDGEAASTTATPATAPRITGMSITSTPADGDGVYKTSERIYVTVTYDAPVTVTGTPFLSMDIGTTSGGVFYRSGSPGSALVFGTQPLLARDSDNDGVSIAAGSVALNFPGDAGTIRSAGGVDADPAHQGIAANVGHRVNVVLQDVTPPALVGVEVVSLNIKLEFDEALDQRLAPPSSAFTVKVNGQARDISSATLNPDPKRFVVRINPGVQYGDVVTVSYAPPETDPLQDAAGNPVAAFTDFEVTNNALRPSSVPPALVGVEVVSLNIKLEFDEALDQRLAPPSSAFTVKVNGQARDISSATLNPDPKRFVVRINPGVQYGDVVTVSYAPPVTNPLQDAAGNDVVAFTDFEVTNNAPRPAGVPGAPRSLSAAPGDGQVTLSWTAPSSAGDSAITRYEYRYKAGSGASSNWASAGTDLTETVGNLTNGLVHTFKVRAVNTQGGGDAASTTAIPAAQGAPVLRSAVVNGAFVTFAFDKALDRASTPDTSAFTATVGGTAATIGSVSIPRGGHGRVRIALNPAARAGQTVTVDYTAPADNPLRSAAGAAVADFSGYTPVNETPPDAVGAGITLVDADGRPLGTLPRLTVPEGGTAQFGFKLNTRPRHPVLVGFSQGKGDTDLRSGSSSVWVLPDQWGNAYFVTVRAYQDDDNVDGERIFETFANSADPQYSVHPGFGSLTMPDLKVVEADDELQIGHATASPLAGLTLFDNGDGGRDVAALAAGTTLGARTSERLNIRAETRAGAAIGSVRLELSGAVSASRTENHAPYALFGDRGGRALPAGTYMIVATPYPEANLGGTPGPGLSVTFTVAAGDTRGPSVEVTSRAAAPVSERFEVTVRFSAPVTGLEVSELAIANGRAMGIAGLTDADGRVTEYSVLVEPDTDAGGEVTVRVPAGVAADAAGNPNTASGTFRIAIAPRLRVTGFTLYDHETGSDVRGLSNGAEIPAQSSSRLNVRAAASGPVASVRLELSGRAAASATENAAPWYLFGDRGNRGARAFPAGTYTVTATPYPEANLGGTAGQALSVSFTVKPHELSVADARAEEGTDATVDFTVTLAPSSPAAVTVEYATSDGTATAGADYTAQSGTLTFARGETSKTVSVAVLDDSHDEGAETFTLTLSNASGASIADGTATGTIENADPMPQAWIARFGRTVAEQVVDSVQARLTAPRTPGAEVSLAGQRIGGSASGAGSAALRDDAAGGAALGAAGETEAQARLGALSDWLRGETGEDRARRLGSRTVSDRDLLTGTSFALAAEAAGGGVAGLWGRGAITGFDGREGDLTLDGEVGSVMLGADWARDAWTAGLMLSHSRGTGSYRGAGEGKVESDLTGLYPYGRYALNERVTLWGVAGYGAGSLTLTPKDKPAIETDMDLAMGAVGVRGVVVQAPAEGGPELAVKSDGLFVRTTSEAVRGGDSNTGNLAAAEADVTRLRLGLEGTWRGLKLGSGELTPRLEIGVRHDGGDAETGFGVDLGGGLAWSDPASGVTAEVSGRGLLTHEAGGFREQGYSGALTWDPGQGTGRGPKLTLTQTMGASATGGMDALLGRGAVAGLAANDNGDDLRRRRLEVKLGYGLSAFGDRFTSTPELGLGLSDTGRDYSLGWRLGLAQGGPTSLELKLEATRREYANPGSGAGAGSEPEHGIGFKLTARW